MSVRFGPIAESVRRWSGWPLILGAALGLGMASAPPKSFAERIGPIRPGPGRLVGIAYAAEGWKLSGRQREMLKREADRLDTLLQTRAGRTVEALRQRAVLSLANGERDRGIALLQEVLERFPHSLTPR